MYKIVKKMAEDNKIWLYNDENHKFFQVKKDDPRLDWNYPHSPKDRVKFSFRLKGKKWNYLSYGFTKEEVAYKENKFLLEEINKLEEKINNIKLRLIKP